MIPSISVLISTHNPNMALFQRTLRAVAMQTLDESQWELLVIDNASDKPVNIDENPRGRKIREERLGKTYGLLAGIRESQSGILVVVDDDNELAPDYLE